MYHVSCIIEFVELPVDGGSIVNDREDTIAVSHTAY